MAYEILLTVLDRGFSFFPALILRRFYTQQRLDKQVLIDTRTTNPIEFSLGSSIPTVHAWFTVANFTNLVWRIRDFSAEIWVGQPIATVRCEDKPTIPRKKITSVFAKCFLNELQVNRLNEFRKRQTEGYVDNIRVSINAQFESKLGLVQFKPTLENRPISIR